MTTYTGNTSGLFLQNGDVIAPGAIVGVLNGFYVVQIDNDAVVRIAGTVWGGMAVLANPGVILTVTPTGSLSGSDRSGLEMTDGGTLNNYGSIDGENYGVVMGGGGSNVITNVGLISGDNYGLYVFAGSSYTSLNFNNLGGTVIAATAIAGAGDLTTINNTGLIASYNGTAGTAVTPAGSKLVLTNSGTILGKVFGGVQNDVVVNNGQMQGDVDLGAGNDTYRGVGWVDGTVLGNDGNDTLTGGIYDDALNGGADNDILDGGRGDDVMTGGSGNDTFYVDSLGDRVIEAAGGGADTVYTTVSYTLRAGQEIETLSVNPDADYANVAIDLTGNEFANTLIGNAANNKLDGKGGTDTMIGGDGDDTYYVDDAGDVVMETANHGTDTVYTSVSYTLPANVEILRAQGSADIALTGNAGRNTIVGNAGNNRLDGGAGADAMSGGDGNDTYIVDNAGDVVTELAGEGIDTVSTTLSRYTLGADVERLLFTGAGNFVGIGNALANDITGGAGNDTLNGGVGADTMTGGAGNDTCYVDDIGDVVTELVGQGSDLVRTTLSSYTLGADVERLLFTGSGNFTGNGNGLDNGIVGGAGNDTLYGGAGNDVLTGGLGADIMVGGTGHDTYYVDNIGDVVTELAGEGTDKVSTTLSSYTLGAEVERLLFTGVGNFVGTGNGLDNGITGGAGNDTLYGGAGNDTLNGGAGADVMVGGTGNDVFYVDNVGDVVTELAGEGTDAVSTTLSNYTLGANVERLVFTGAGSFTGTGNALDNGITGGAGDDVLTGNGGNDTLNGGAGADIMTGGTGSDSYYVDNIGDVVTELTGEGTDIVFASLSYALTQNVERLALSGAANIDGTGNELANVLTGNAGANVLDGGLGSDTLTGGGGNDTFRFSTALGAANVDRIVDFHIADDTIQLDATIFTAIDAGLLSADAFFIGAAAHDADDRILYNSTTGALSYDADGNGAAAAVQFAILAPTLALTHDHLLVV